MKDKIELGRAPDCFGKDFVESGYRKKGIDELQAAWVAGCNVSSPFFIVMDCMHAG
jgi:hypothetical protein